MNDGSYRVSGIEVCSQCGFARERGKPTTCLACVRWEREKWPCSFCNATGFVGVVFCRECDATGIDQSE